MSAPVHGTFTPGDLWRGALWAWAGFVVLMEVSLAIATVVADIVDPPTAGGGGSASYLPFVLGYALFIGGSVSLLVMLIGAPVAGLLAVTLRGVTSRGAHLAAFAAYGAAIGAIAVGIAAATGGTFLLGVTALVTITICATATAFGWSRAERHARRAAAGHGISRADPDALVEDAIADRG